MNLRKHTITLIVATITAGLLAGLLALPAHALTAAQCAALAGLAVPSTTITSAVVITAGGGLPEYCRVQGRVDTEINFELRLPTTTTPPMEREVLPRWRHRVRGIHPDLSPRAGSRLRGRWDGHRSRRPPPVPGLDGSWALNHPDRQLNFAHRAIHVATLAAKQITTAAYGRAPEYSYFEGCSTGGRQAAMEAQRYPTDFQGIIAGAPALDLTGAMLRFNWNAQALQTAPLPPDKLPVIASAVLAQCDGKDTPLDGLVETPRRCKFDPAVLTCPGGVDGPDCLTPAQVETVRMIYGGPVNSAGEQLHPGVPPGHEDGGTGWQMWMTGPSAFGPPVNFVIPGPLLPLFRLLRSCL